MFSLRPMILKMYREPTLLRRPLLSTKEWYSPYLLVFFLNVCLKNKPNMVSKVFEVDWTGMDPLKPWSSEKMFFKKLRKWRHRFDLLCLTDGVDKKTGNLQTTLFLDLAEEEAMINIFHLVMNWNNKSYQLHLLSWVRMLFKRSINFHKDTIKRRKCICLDVWFKIIISG